MRKPVSKTAERDKEKAPVRTGGGGRKKRIAGGVSQSVTAGSPRGIPKTARQIDFRRDKFDIAAKVVAIENDPDRGVRLARLRYDDGEERYILCPANLEVGQTVISGVNAEIVAGNALALKNIPVGTPVHNVELRPGKGAQMARSADRQARLVSHEGGFAMLQRPSGEIRRISGECLGTVGQLPTAFAPDGQGEVTNAAVSETPAFLSKPGSAPLHFAQVYRRAVEVVGNAENAMRWLGRPIPALNYATPVSLLRHRRGRDAVLDVLGRLEHGVF